MYTQITLVGNLGGDPEMRFLPSGQAVCNFSLATNRNWTDQNGEKQTVTTWWRIAAWGKLAENCTQYLHKGSKVLVAGDTVEARPWVDNQGEARASLEFTARSVQFLDSRSNNNEHGTVETSQPHVNGTAPADDDTKRKIPF